MMSQILIRHLDFTYDGDHTPVFHDLNLQLDTSWKLGLVGRNGRGKTTLLRLLAGELSGSGELVCPERAVYFPRPAPAPDRRAREVLLEEIPPEDQWKLLRELSKLGLAEELLDRPFQSLSGGEQTRARLAALFCCEEGYPVIDEPTNHLDERGRALTADYLRGLRRGFLLVSHDRAFLDGCTDHTLALNPAGQELIRGSFSVWYGEKENRDRREAAQNEKLQGEIRRLERAARRTAGWSDRVEQSKYRGDNSGLKVDRGFVGHKSAKMMKRSKSIAARQESALEEKRGLLKDVERADSLKLSPMTYPGGRLLELRDAAVCFGGRPVCAPCSLQVAPGDRLAILGGNGSGKTSLLRLLMGEEVPSAGLVRRGSGLVISYVPQRSDHLSGLPAEFARAQGMDRTQFFTVLRKLDFSRALLERDMSGYSAGQKKKVLLAASLCQKAHLYVWDEPLNYIDLFSRIQLEELILQYRPTMVFVEHDRLFRERVATAAVELCPAERRAPPPFSK